MSGWILRAVVVGLVAWGLVWPMFRTTRVVDVSSDRGEPVAAAPLKGIDHRASGKVEVIEGTGGKPIVRFVDVDIQPGPDYLVYVVSGTGKTSPEGGAELGRLRASKGSFEYELKGLEHPGELTVLVWCRAFAVPIAAADLAGLNAVVSAIDGADSP